jgi:hypothetical protein
MVWLVTSPHSPVGSPVTSNAATMPSAVSITVVTGGRGVRAAGGDRHAAGGHRGALPATDSSTSIRRTVPGNLFAYLPCLDLTIG